MSRKCGDVATVRCKLKLMVTRVQVYFREHCGAVKVMDKVINRRGYMTFTEDCTIRLMHVNKNTNLIKIFWFGGSLREEKPTVLDRQPVQ